MNTLILCALLWVSDGDTVRLRCAGEDLKVRIQALDCAELPTREGHRAKQALSALLTGPITIERRGYDRYGRTVAVVRANGVDVACELMKSGHCRRYTKYDTRNEYAGCER